MVAGLVGKMIREAEFYRILDEVVPGGSFGEVKSSQERQLYLTRLSMDGLNEMHEYSMDERLYEYFEFKPFNTIGDTEKYLKRLMSLEGEKILGRTAIAWFVRCIEDDSLIGTARLVNIDYNRKSVEWGYGIDPKLWGEGYVFEIQELLKEYIFEECFYCVYYGHLSFTDAYNLPIKWRKWWLNKISEINEAENQKRMQPAVMPSKGGGSRSLRARDIGR